MKSDTKIIQAIHDHVIIQDDRISVSHIDHCTWFLHIKNVREKDAGQYMCQVNSDPMISQVIKKYTFEVVDFGQLFQHVLLSILFLT